MAEELPLKDNGLYENEIALFNITSSHRIQHKRELIVQAGIHKLM